ncbi:MAG: hypothetical protein JXA67_18530 [Micromonosporaceae bacterium]|nr:hypothetical protein [Micromonosporaceae bacterium]
MTDERTEMPGAASNQYGNFQQADKIFNYHTGDDSDSRFQAGERNLYDRLYPAAARSFDEYFSRLDQISSPASQQRETAHLYNVLALLSGDPPSYRSPRDAEQISAHLLAAQGHRWAAILAAYVKADYFDAAGMKTPAAFATLAAQVRFDSLTAEDVKFLSDHLAPIDGQLWQMFASHANQLGAAVQIAPTATLAAAPAPDENRRIGVIKYFSPTPIQPAPVMATTAVALAWVGGFLLIVGIATCGLGASNQNAPGTACMGIPLLATAGGLLIAANTAFGRYRAYQRVLDEFRRQWAAAEPKPSDEQISSWLADDVKRIEVLGARRHRLSLNEADHGGDLLVVPQSVVGISRRTRDVMRTRMVPTAAGPMSVLEQALEPVARSKRGRDGHLRADNYHVLVIYLTRSRVCAFECELELATRRLVSEEAQSFRYDDVIKIASETISAPHELQRAVNMMFDDGSGRYSQIYVDDRFTLSTVDGGRIVVSIGFSGRTTTGQGTSIAWGNQQVLGIVERMVWSQKEPHNQ